MPSPRGIGTEGHITQAPLRAKEQKESQLGIAFDRAVLKTETDLPLVAQIQAIVAPPSARTNENTGQPAYPGTTSGALPVAARRHAAGQLTERRPRATSHNRKHARCAGLLEHAAVVRAERSEGLIHPLTEEHREARERHHPALARQLIFFLDAECGSASGGDRTDVWRTTAAPSRECFALFLVNHAVLHHERNVL